MSESDEGRGSTGLDDAPPAQRREGDRKSQAVRRAIRSELETDASEQAGRPEERPGQPKPVIELSDVSLSFDVPILEEVSFTAHEGETIAVVGESGTGKSTILKLILRLLVPDRGMVCIDDEDITDLSFEEALKVRQKMGMVFQGAALFDSMTVFENVAYPLREHTHMSEDEIEQRVREKLEFVDLDADRVMEQMPAELSGGMRKRVGIARGMANNPEIMLYDEPTSGLDPLTTGTITRLIRKLQKELGVTSIVVSHDMRSVSRMASKIALLHERHIVFFGEPEEMFASEDPYIREFLGG
ncbi:MAG TPA: ABC transporter ATP-binding protein [Gemmatimonadaceae bacterium]|jgi:phospholipid/cholesterol/gamma-HCH transport system ATP-binding protein|nr:ABC transporter ATP-binding protein [Gemmatimonadaceae bacterium]